MFQNSYVTLGEDVNAVVITRLSRGDERACGEVVEDVDGLRFGGKCASRF